MLVHELFRFFSADMVCCLYTWLLPRAWWLLFVVDDAVVGHCFPGGGDEPLWPAVTVIPMGWLSATSIAQNLHHRVV